VKQGELDSFLNLIFLHVQLFLLTGFTCFDKGASDVTKLREKGTLLNTNSKLPLILEVVSPFLMDLFQCWEDFILP
jgi:hypothetical protein